jgi:hypothetical protein
MREEFVASAKWVSRGDDVVDEERSRASMISSLKPICWRMSRPVETEYVRIFWSAWSDDTEEVEAVYLDAFGYF